MRVESPHMSADIAFLSLISSLRRWRNLAPPRTATKNKPGLPWPNFKLITMLQGCLVSSKDSRHSLDAKAREKLDAYHWIQDAMRKPHP
jgi:hypothetical protein